jgi:hypothetical protein
MSLNCRCKLGIVVMINYQIFDVQVVVDLFQRCSFLRYLFFVKFFYQLNLHVCVTFIELIQICFRRLFQRAFLLFRK